MFSRGELSHGQVELYQIVQHKNIQELGGERAGQIPAQRERPPKGYILQESSCRGKKLGTKTLIFLLHCQPHSSLQG